MKDLYKILNVPEDADEATIKKSYRKLAKEFHPDATGGDKKKTERFKDIGEAYAVLGDKEKRAEYDRLKHMPMGADGMPQGFDPDTFAQVFGGGFGRQGGNVNVSGDFNGDIGDLFASLFGRGGFAGGGRPGGRGPGPRVARGPDMSGVLEVSFREAALGTRRSLRTGAGSTVEVAVPPGVDTGGRLRLPGQGGAPPRPGGQPGDLHLEVRVAPDPHLRRSAQGNGLDVEVDVPLSAAEAIFGTKVDVPTVEGSATVTIPPGTSSGARLRLRGKGIKKQDGSRGDQICRIEIVVPKLTPDDDDGRKLHELLTKVQNKPVRTF
ncbi:MAG TPA: J domain-containing protein [Polyangia bacterium]